MITLMGMQISLIDNDFSGNFKGGGNYSNCHNPLKRFFAQERNDILTN